MKKICIITDHELLYEALKKIIRKPIYLHAHFDFFFSFNNVAFGMKYKSETFRPICLADQDEFFFSSYDLFISLHCRQVFPKELVENHICINVHPGYNPYNRGWFPHVFSILNGLPIGVTIHRMDTELDHGPVIYQQEVKIDEADTSYEVYEKIQNLEICMLDEFLPSIINGNYTEHPLSSEGNINYKRDFARLCEIDLKKPATYGEVIDYLRAMTFTGFRNAFFRDNQGNKIFVSIEFQSEIY